MNIIDWKCIYCEQDIFSIEEKDDTHIYTCKNCNRTYTREEKEEYRSLNFAQQMWWKLVKYRLVGDDNRDN